MTTLTQQFAAEYAKGVVPAMLKAVTAAKRDTRLIVAGVLAITYPHQALWVTTIHGVGWLGWIIPAVVDLAMLRMLGIVQTTGMRRQAKTAALVMTGLLAVMSAAVNVAAPAALAARAIFGALVLMAAGVKVVTSLVGPDFAAIEATETAVTAPVGPGRRCEPGCTCGKHRPRKAAAKPRPARKPRTPKVPTYAADAVLAETASAPTSPAPYGA